MTFGENLLKLRKSKGVSQEQLAEVMGLTRQTISKWELNQSTPDLQYVMQMSEYFEVSIDYLIKGETASISEEPEQNHVQDAKQSNKIIGYKWLFILGLALSIVSMLGMIIFAVCAAIKPHEYWIDDMVYRGLAGFLRGTDSQGFFAALNIMFLSGIGCTIWGIIKQLRLTN